MASALDTPSVAEDGLFVDAETASRWTLLGLAVEGELAGTQLAPIIAFDHFWFAWAAFHPDSDLYVATQ